MASPQTSWRSTNTALAATSCVVGRSIFDMREVRAAGLDPALAQRALGNFSHHARAAEVDVVGQCGEVDGMEVVAMSLLSGNAWSPQQGPQHNRKAMGATLPASKSLATTDPILTSIPFLRRKGQLFLSAGGLACQCAYLTSPRCPGIRPGLGLKTGRNMSNRIARARNPNPTPIAMPVAANLGTPTPSATRSAIEPHAAAET